MRPGKLAETLDRLSGGRLILGLGGGSSDDEHCAFGLEVRSPREKVDGLEDALDFAGLGFNAFHFVPAGSDAEEQAERLAGEVVPAVRAATG